jgi:hypothetical protein
MMIAFQEFSEPLVKNIPEIIKQASQSQLGILALLIIVLTLLASYFFRTAAMKVRVLIWFLFFAATAAYAVEITRAASKPETRHYVGRTMDKVSSLPVRDASLSLKPTPQSEPWHSDSEGRFSFWVLRDKPTEDVQLIIDHENYSQYSRIVSSDENASLGDILLAPVGPDQPGAPPPTPAPSSVETNGDQHHSANVSPHSTIGAIVGAVVVHPLQAPQHTSTAALAMLPKKIATVDSGPKSSGVGKNWSEWYRLNINAAPPAYVIEKIEFWLSGDRSCGAWAECRQVSANEAQVVWEFRMQGHDEWGAPPRADSEGHLRVTYRPR